MSASPFSTVSVIRCVAIQAPDAPLSAMPPIATMKPCRDTPLRATARPHNAAPEAHHDRQDLGPAPSSSLRTLKVSQHIGTELVTIREGPKEWLRLSDCLACV